MSAVDVSLHPENQKDRFEAFQFLFRLTGGDKGVVTDETIEEAIKSKNNILKDFPRLYATPTLDQLKAFAKSHLPTFNFNPAGKTSDECKATGNEYFIQTGQEIDRLNAIGQPGNPAGFYAAYYCYYCGIQKVEEEIGREVINSCRGWSKEQGRRLAILYANTANAQLAIQNEEMNECALYNSEMAIAYDPTYLKSYHRAIAAISKLPGYKVSLELDKCYLNLALTRANAEADSSFMNNREVSILVAQEKRKNEDDDEEHMNKERDTSTIKKKPPTKIEDFKTTSNLGAQKKANILKSFTLDTQENCGVWPTQRPGKVQCVLVRGTPFGNAGNMGMPGQLGELETVFIEDTHTMFRKAYDCPVMSYMGIPLAIHRKTPGVAKARTDNICATYFMIDRFSGFAAPLWQGGVGDVVILRKDKKPLTKGDVFGLWDYFNRTLDQFGDGDVHICKQHYKRFEDSYNESSEELIADGYGETYPLNFTQEM